MKKIISISFLALALASCSHFGGGCCGKQCDMKKEKCADCSKDKGQCPMKETKEAKTEETKK